MIATIALLLVAQQGTDAVFVPRTPHPVIAPAVTSSVAGAPMRCFDAEGYRIRCPNQEGQALADDLVRALNSGEPTPKNTVVRFQALSVTEEDAVLEAIRTKATGSKQATRLYAKLKAAQRGDEARPYLASAYRYRGQEEVAQATYAYEAMKKSPALAWALSFFLGFGLGNFYADAPGTAVGVLLFRGGTAALAFASDGDLRTIAIGMNILGWVIDWGAAIANANAYNEDLRGHIAISTTPEGMPTVGLAMGW